jgi:hypothetical protein
MSSVLGFFSKPSAKKPVADVNPSTTEKQSAPVADPMESEAAPATSTSATTSEPMECEAAPAVVEVAASPDAVVVESTTNSEETPKETAKEAEAEEEDTGPKDFNELWPSLKAEGWTYKNGGGLVAWLYLPPGLKSIKGAKEGVDYWSSLTEDALFSHVTGKPMPVQEIVEETGRRARTSRKTDRYVDEVSLENKPKRKRASNDDEHQGSGKKQRPNIPKKPASAYACFARTMRPKLMEATEDADLNGQVHCDKYLIAQESPNPCCCSCLLCGRKPAPRKSRPL